MGQVSGTRRKKHANSAFHISKPDNSNRAQAKVVAGPSAQSVTPGNQSEMRPRRPSPSMDDDYDTLTTVMPKYYTVDWSKNGILGAGHYATVFRGRNKLTGEPVAIKRIKRVLTRPATLNTEIRALRKVKGHENIVQLYEVYYNKDYVVLVLEMLAGGELFDRIVRNGAYSERDASQHVRKITLALKYMHSHGIVHRDLKPENLVLVSNYNDSDIKISDFGLSKILNDDQQTMNTVCGTRAYSAPEINFGGGRKSPGYDAKVDTWSLGVILYIILAAFHPFDEFGDSNDVTIWTRICRGQWDFNDDAWDKISDDAKDLVTNMLTCNPAKRYGTEEILNHRWITQHNTLPSTPLRDNYHRGPASRPLHRILSASCRESQEIPNSGAEELDTGNNLRQEGNTGEA